MTIILFYGQKKVNSSPIFGINLTHRGIFNQRTTHRRDRFWQARTGDAHPDPKTEKIALWKTHLCDSGMDHVTQPEPIKGFEIYFRNLEETTGRYSLLTSTNDLMITSTQDVLITPTRPVILTLSSSPPTFWSCGVLSKE